jgi:adenylate cyclase
VRNVTPDAPTFAAHQSSLLSALTDYAAIAIENARNLEELEARRAAENAHIRDTFERFVPPKVVNEALNAPESLHLGGKRREISVLFADIRGYSTWSENTSPEAVIETLNHYLSLAAEIILAWDGTLDKFMGDGMMAVFNAPQDQPDHVHRAADAALALLKAADEVQLQHGHRLNYSIGVHVGEALVGYIGTERAMNYTAVGDTVNLAKRLQEYAAPGQILVEESVIKRLGTLAQARPLGEIKVKGRKRAALAYELSGLLYEEK